MFKIIDRIMDGVTKLTTTNANPESVKKPTKEVS